jgi:predicted Zn-dependent peptidase
MILSAAGGVDPDEMVPPGRGGLRPSAGRPADEGRARAFLGGREARGQGRSNRRIWRWRSRRRATDDDIHTAQIYATALGGGMSSRLFQEIRERRGLCYTIYSQAGAFDDTGMLTIYAGTSGERSAIWWITDRRDEARSADDMSAAELDRARAQMKAGLLMGLESPSARAERNARLVAIWDRVPPLEETVARIDAVSWRGAARPCAEAHRLAPVGLALYGPVESAPDMPGSGRRLAA